MATLPLPGTTPHTLSYEEYRSKWKPKGWELIWIGPTATWREAWGEWEAIRDIVQNALDETEAYQWGRDEQGLWIGDKGGGMAVHDFLLGPPKPKPEWARGRFGEGLKIASLSLLRRGYSLHVQTMRKELWLIFMPQKVNGQVESLAALWKPNGTRAGTRFHIIGYRGSAFENNFAMNLPRSLILAQVPSWITQPQQRYNQLIRAEGPASSAAGGKIYCRDIMLEEILSPFSYNLWGFTIAPDRHGPERESEMFSDMGRLWCGVTNVALLKTLLQMLTDPPIHTPSVGSFVETKRLELHPYLGMNPMTKKSYSTMLVDNAELWQKAWEQVMGKNKVLRTDPKYDGMVTHLAYESQSVQLGVRSGLQLVIKTDVQVVREMSDRLDQAERIPDANLTEVQHRHLTLARAIADDYGGIMAVNAAIIPPASDMVDRTAGLYEFGTGMIKISADMLERAERTVSVMIHELGHHVAYRNTRSKELASDLTRGHALAMEEVTGDTVRKLMKGAYDDALENVRW